MSSGRFDAGPGRLAGTDETLFPRRGTIRDCHGLSAHADRDDLLGYVRAIKPLPSRVFIVHGEDRQSFSLAAAIRAEHPGLEVTVPDPSTIYDV